MSDYVKSLPNELLLVIFDGVPLSELLLLDQVCPRWATLIPSACARRTDLVLLVGGKRMDEIQWAIPFNDDCKLSFGTRPFYDLPAHQYKAYIQLPFFLPPQGSFEDYLSGETDDFEGFFDILYRSEEVEETLTELARLKEAYSSCSEAVVSYFTNLFPKIHNLVVIHDPCTEHHTLIGLVSSWSLVSLKLWAFFDWIIRDAHPNQQPIHVLLQTIITKQHSLQQLTLDMRGTDVAYPAQFPMFISQLKMVKLCIGYYDPDGNIWDLVHRGDSDQLGQIGLANYVDTDRQLDETILNPRYRFTAKVRQLYRQFIIYKPVHLADLCQRYCSLTLLKLFWAETITFTVLASNLASLPLLTHLELRTQFHHEFSPQNPFALLDQAADAEGGEEPARRISLPQVKTLEFHLGHKRTHAEFESLQPFVFPSVEVIVLRDGVRNCSICGLNERAGLGTGACHRELILSLKNKFAGSLGRLYAIQGFIYPVSAWTDWSNYLHVPDDQFPEVGDLEETFNHAENEDDQDDFDQEFQDDFDEEVQEDFDEEVQEDFDEDVEGDFEGDFEDDHQDGQDVEVLAED